MRRLNTALLGSDAIVWSAHDRGGLFRLNHQKAAVAEGSNNGFTQTRSGPGAKWTRATNGGLDFGIAHALAGTAVTMLVVAAPTASASNRKSLLSWRSGGTNVPQIGLYLNVNAAFSAETGDFMLYSRNTSATVSAVLDTSSSVDGGLHCWAAGNSTVASSGYIYRDGVALSPSTNQALTGTYADGAQQTAIGNLGAYSTDGAYVSDDPILLAIMWPRRLQPGLAAELSRLLLERPNAAFERRRIFSLARATLNAYTLTAAQGSYTLTGQAAALSAARKLVADQGSYTLSGQAANLLRGLQLAAAQGSYTLSGQAAGLAAARRLAADQGSYTLSGQAANLLRGLQLAAAQGSYALTGQSATLTVTRALAAGQGAYALTGQAANLLKGFRLTAAQGAYLLNGQDASLIYTPAGGYTIAAAHGTYALTGQAAGLLATRRIVAAQGAYSIAGQAVGLLRAYSVTAGQGAYALTGQATTFVRTYALAAAYGSYGLTGQTVTLTWSGEAAPAVRAAITAYRTARSGAAGGRPAQLSSSRRRN